MIRSRSRLLAAGLGVVALLAAAGIGAATSATSAPPDSGSTPLPFTSFTGATVPVTGVEKDLGGVYGRHTIYAVDTSGDNVADNRVILQGSHDGQHWFRLASVPLVANPDPNPATVDTHLVRYVRADLIDIDPDNFYGTPVVTATIASGT